MSALTYLPKKIDGRTYLAKERARQLEIIKIIRDRVSINQASLLKELSKRGLKMAEMTLQTTLGAMIAVGQILSTQKGRETIYSLPSRIEMLNTHKEEVASMLDIREHEVYDRMVVIFGDPRFRADQKIRFATSNLRSLLADFSKLLIFNVLRNEEELYKDAELALRKILQNMITLIEKDKKDGELILRAVMTNLFVNDLIDYKRQER